MTNKEKEISGDGEWININECVPLGFHHTVPCLFNRGCQEENFVRLRPIHPREVFFSARSPSPTTAVVYWRSHRGQTLGPLDFLGSVITTTWRERGNTVLFCYKKRRTCRHVCMAIRQETFTHCTHTKTVWTNDLLRSQKEVGWESSPEQLPARNSITTVCVCLCVLVHVWMIEREKEGKHVILSPDCYIVSVCLIAVIYFNYCGCCC